ncbi:MAG: hypothetical protein AAF587_17485 [Bacteroidota bacterium]
MNIFRHSLLFRIIAVYAMSSILWQVIQPAAAYALTSGPTMPEYEQFAPPGINDLVDPSTGDLAYQISLFNLEGQDVSITYSGPTGNQGESSSLGMGWNFTPGAIMRQVRGIPDEFNGEQDLIRKEFNLRPNRTLGLKAGNSFQMFGIGRLGINIGAFHNNYNGWGTEYSLVPSLTAANKAGGSMTASMGLGFNSQAGISVSPSLSFQVQSEKTEEAASGKESTTTTKTYGMGISSSYNSRSGLKYLGLDVSYKRNVKTDQLLKVNARPGEIALGAPESFTTRIAGNPKTDREGAANGVLVSYGTPTYTPQQKFPFLNTSLTLNATIGGAGFGAHPALSFTGYYTEQALAYHHSSIPAFGYFHQERTVDATHALLDFNREKDGVFIDEASLNLPLPFSTYDLYTATGQAGVGMFHAQRSDRGLVFDDDMLSLSADQTLGAEFGVTSGTHNGASFKVNLTESSSGKWVKDNELAESMKFQSKKDVGPDFEPYFFKKFGETPVEDATDDFLGKVGGTKAVRVKLENRGKIVATNEFEDKQNNPYTANSYHRTQRAKRNTGMFMLNGEEASQVGVESMINGYSLNSTTGEYSMQAIPRISANRPAHHPSEFKVYNDGGGISVYGLPVYNTLERNVTFAAAGIPSDCETGLIDYTPQPSTDPFPNILENQVNGQFGRDDFFSADEIPTKAYAYLLTAVLSSDYVDLTGDGITDDDLGTAYQYHYEQVYGEESGNGLYDWRSPYATNSATLMEGYINRPDDDKASYTYGTKEIYRLTGITSDNLRLDIIYSDRLDGYGVQGENGGFDQNKNLFKVDRMELYNKKDRELNGDNANLLKAAEFEYSYELCKQTPNNINTHNGINPDQSGKLTLKKIRFRFGTSNRAPFNPYEFYYADPDHDKQIDPKYNPDYEEKSQDRWGNYQPNSCAGDDLPNWEFPYTDQTVIPASDPLHVPAFPNRRYADIRAQAWRLTSVVTPGGSHLKFNYEADRIAYVEDKIAGQMHKILGTGPTSDMNHPDFGNELYKKEDGPGNFTNHNFVFFELPTKVQNRDELFRRYLKDIEYLYFNFDMDISGENQHERVPGYVEIKDYGVQDNGNTLKDVGWMEVEPKAMKDKDKAPWANPFSRDGWDFARANLNEMIFPGSGPPSPDESGIRALAGFLMDLRTIFQGYNKALRAKEFCRTFKPHRSWLRLNCPDGQKVGGGVRVTKVFTDDDWANMGGGITATYGQTYDYSITNDYDEIQSSGVASYEPMLGGDEIPHRQPRYFTKKNTLTLDDIFYLEEPMGESQFPAPSIKYSKVTVKSLPYSHGGTDVTQNGVGHTEYEYYTARDFPTIVEETDIDPYYRKPNPILKFFRIGVKQHTTASQGYSVTTNNMHGVPKAVSQFAENKETAVTETRYEYRTVRDGKHVRLDNENIPVIYPDNQTGTASLGVEMDFTVDSRQQQTITDGFDTQGNLDILGFFIPFPAATIIPTPIYEEKRFRSITTTKLIRRTGVLDRIISRNDGAVATTHNLAYDAETGALLISKSTNEYLDEQYSLNYPAHWAYQEGMGQVAINTGMQWTDNVHLAAIQDPEDHFVKGDELMLRTAGTSGGNDILSKAWVLDVGPTSFAVIDETGQLVPDGPYDEVKIIRSGRKNMAGASIASTITRTHPISNGGIHPQDVLATGAAEYSDRWQKLCGPVSILTTCPCVELTQEAIDLQDLLNALLTNGELDNSIVNLATYSVFSGSSLEAALFPGGIGSGCSAQFQSVENAPNGNCEGELAITFGENCGSLVSSCSISLTPDVPHPYCMSHFSSFSNIRPVIDDPDACVSSTKFQIDAHVSYDCNSSYDDVVTFTGDMNCFPIRECHEEVITGSLCGNEGDDVNPYVEGIRGNWSAKKTYTLLDYRGPSDPIATSSSDIRREGTLQNFSPFWQFNNGEWEANQGNWIWTSEATKRIPQGYDVESVDPLGRYSSALYGYDLSVNVALVGNSRYQESMNANFEMPEDYALDCNAHIRMDGLTISSDAAHTGLRSAEITPSEPLSLVTMISEADCIEEADDIPYTIKACDCAKAFSPIEKGRYSLSFWIKGEEYDSSPLAVYEYPHLQTEIYLDGNLLSILDEQQSKLIEGWQRREIVVEIPDGTAGESFELIFSNSGMAAYKMYIDDIRFHNFYGGMQTYVYDPGDLILTAVMGERGFATFYRYDEANKLVGIQQETENGILSVSAQQDYIPPRSQ